MFVFHSTDRKVKLISLHRGNLIINWLIFQKLSTKHIPFKYSWTYLARSVLAAIEAYDVSKTSRNESAHKQASTEETSSAHHRNKNRDSTASLTSNTAATVPTTVAAAATAQQQQQKQKQNSRNGGRTRQTVHLRQVQGAGALQQVM